MSQKHPILHRARYAVPGVCAALAAFQLTVSAQTLVNRYSFSETDDGAGNMNATVYDSVGGANGTLPWGGTFTNAQLQMQGGLLQYVNLPAGILSNYTAVTVDVWAEADSGLAWASFLFVFGNTDTGGAGADYIFGSLARQYACISGVDPGYNGEQGTSTGAFLNNGPVHFTAVFDPPEGYVALYTNGVLQSINRNVTTNMSAVQDTESYINRSLYTADPYSDLNIDEFRIWNGALNALQVAGCDVAGPTVVGSATNVGTATSITLTVPYYQLVQDGHETAVVTAQFTQFSSPLNVSPSCTYSSGNTNILTVDTNGVITALAQGSASITAYYGSLSNSVTITAVPPASALAHRYSFSGNAADLVGGAAWDGTLPNGGDFTTTPGQALLSAAGSEYVQFPEGIISNYTSVTVDMWATLPTTLPGNCFLWAFGLTTGGAGGDCIFVQPLNGRLAISGGMPSWQAGEQNAYGAGDLSGKTNVHLTAVVNPVAGWEALYVNGNLVGKNTAVTVPMTAVASVNNYIARSLYDADSYIDLNVDEYRIFNGALSSQGIAIADQSGPNSVPNTITNGPGSLLGFSIQAPSTLEVLTAAPVKVLANYQYLTNFDLVANSVLPVAGLTISSSDTNVLTYGTDGNVHGVKPGAAILTVTYQGVSSPKTITVTPATYTGVLVHRYSFSDAPGSTTVADSIGGPAWDGTLPAGGTFSGGQLSLSATNASGAQYVNLPAGILSNYTAVSFETWVTVGNSTGNSCLFSFGDTIGSGGADYIFCNAQGGRICISTNNAGWQGTGEQNAYSGINWNGLTLHVVGVVNPPKGYIAIYTNGVLAGVNSAENQPMSGVVNNYSYLNKSLYPGDVPFDATFNEFRIYNGALTPDDVALTQALGPDVLIEPKLSAASIGHSVVLSWPTNAAGYNLTSKGSVSGSGGWNPVGTSPVISGANYLVTLPATNTAQFFRLTQ